MREVDFSNPQWRDRKLSKYLFEVFKHEKALIDNDISQHLFYALGKVERELWNIYDTDKSKFFSIFDKNVLNQLYMSKDKFKEKVDEEIKPEPWLARFNPYKNLTIPLINLFAQASGKKKEQYENVIDAVKSLAYKLGGDEVYFDNPSLMANIEYIHKQDVVEYNGYFFGKCMTETGSFEVPTYKVGIAVQNYIYSDLVNKKYIDANPNAVVLVINSITLPKKLQNQHIRDYRKEKIENMILYLERNQIEFNKNLFRADSVEIMLQNTIDNLKILINGGDWYEVSNPTCSSNSGKSMNEVKYHRIPGAMAMLGDSSSQVVWSSFYGGNNNLDNIDLTPLRERNVYWILHQNASREEMLPKFIKAYSYIHDKELNDLHFIHIPEITDIINSEKSGITIWNQEELILEAFDNKIEIPKALKEKFAEVLARKQKNKRQENYIIEPVIRKNAITLMTAKAGHGKSYLSMGLSYAAATKGKLFGTWKVKEKVKVLYIIDREVDVAELKKRKEMFEKIYKLNKKSKSITFHPVSNFNLLQIENRNEVLQKLTDAQLLESPEGEPVKLLVFDHLTKLMGNVSSPQTWSELRPWFDYLVNELQISILLLHHQNKSGNTYGTSFIENDVGIHIHLDRNNVDDYLSMNVTLPKNRHGKIQTTPFKVDLHMGSESIGFRSDAKDTNISWKKLSNEERCEKFALMREKGMKNAEVADVFGMGIKSIEKLIRENKLAKGGHVQYLPQASSEQNL